jgi:hypothetical protein
MANPLTFYDLPLKARNLVYKYLELTGYTVDLNYTEFCIYPQNEYPDDSRADIAEGLEEGSTITRCEDYRTLEEYWEWSCDELYSYRSSYNHKYDGCEKGNFTAETVRDEYGSKAEAPEIFKTIYKSNHFRICRGSPGGFAPFFQLPTDALCELGTLTVRLDGEPQETIKLDGDWARLKRLAPLKLYSRHGKTAMKEWERLIQRLTECVRPSHLTLYLIVNVPDIKTAEAVLKPLGQLPTLKNCGIWLSSKSIPQFNRLIRTTIGRLTTPSLDHRNMPTRTLDQPFRYLDLPQELRCRILEYSDLISGADLEWKPSISSLGNIRDPRCSCEKYFGHRFDHTHIEDCKTEYLEPSDVGEFFTDWDIASISAEHCFLCEHDSLIKICKKTQAGFCECIFHCTHSADSSSTVPTSRKGVPSLFLVSHQVREDAIPVFFRRNRFIISPPGIVPIRFFARWPERLHLDRAVLTMQRVELSLFLVSLPRGALHHIRYLEWVLPQFANYRTAPKSAYLDYLDTIDMMTQAMNLPLLTLVLNLRVVDRDTHWEDSFWPRRYDRDGKMYETILNPLCRLKGLKDCFVYLRRIPKKGAYRSNYTGKHGWVFDNDEMRYEKAVMGPKYDSAKRGKPWMERFEQKMVAWDWTRWEGHSLDAYGDYCENT